MADASAVAPEAWSDIIETVATTVEREPDFFPAATILSVPDLTSPWDPPAHEVVVIGIWDGEGSSTSASIDGLAGVGCRLDGATWRASMSRGLLLEGAERILAAARLSHDDGEPLIPEDAEAAITVAFDPTKQLVRTSLDFDVPAAFLRLGGTCWIDDTLSIDVKAGRVVTTTTTGMDVDPFVESGCQKFREFMTAGGAGERALSLLPAEAALADGTFASFEATSVHVERDAIVLEGSIERR